MNKLVRLLILACALFALPLVIAAQEGQPITYDQVVTGSITDENTQVPFTFAGTAGDLITITMTSPQTDGPRLDSFLELRGPDGAVLTTDDDSAGNLNSRIEPFTLPTTGNYTIIATRFMQETGTSIGDFELVVSIAEALKLTPGETITIELSDTENIVSLFYGASGDEVLEINAQREGDGSPFTIGARTDDGRFINQTFIGLDQNSGALTPLIFSEARTYIIDVRVDPNYSPDGQIIPVEGVMTVSLTAATIETMPLESGAPITGSLNDSNGVDYHAFESSTSSNARLVLEQIGSSPTEFQIFGPEGFAYNGGVTEFSNTPGTVVIDPLTVNTAGTQLVVVRRFNSQGPSVEGLMADYRLTLTSSETPILENGVLQEGVFGADPNVFEEVYRYIGTAGERIRVTITGIGDEYAPGLFIQGPNATVPGPGGPGGPGFNMNVNTSQPNTSFTYEVTLPTDGEYIFRVNNGFFNPQGGPPAGGTFTLLVEVIE